MVTFLGQWFEMVSRAHPDPIRCVSVSLGVGTEPLYQPLPWAVIKWGRAGELSLLEQMEDTDRALPLFVLVLATEKTSTFRAVVLPPLHKAVTKGAVFRCVRRTE